MKKDNFIKSLKSSLGSKYVLTAKWEKHTFSKGWRYGEGEALAVVKPGTLFEIWNVLKLCVEENVIVIIFVMEKETEKVMVTVKKLQYQYFRVYKCRHNKFCSVIN